MQRQQELFPKRHIAYLAIGTAAFISLASTLFNRYYYLDETWYVRPWNYKGWIAQGRPLLDYLVLLTEYAHLSFGLYAIYVYRIAGIALLTITGGMLFTWLRRFGYPYFSSVMFSIGLISLPAFQVLAATSVQLGVAVISTFLAAFAIEPLLTCKPSTCENIIRASLGVILSLIALCIYQVSFLMLFALLLFPLLQTPKNDFRRHLKLAIAYGSLAAVVVLYYLAWKFFYLAPLGGVNAAYSPEAASPVAVIVGLKDFFTNRLIQAANLWHVQDLTESYFFYIFLLLLIGASLKFIYTERSHGVLKLLAALASLPICEVFRLAAMKAGTYTTMHPLQLAVWLLIIWSVHILLGQSRWVRWTALTAGILGTILGSWTTWIYISVRNGEQFRALEEALLASPGPAKLHVFGAASNYPEPYEYGWTSAAVTNYLSAMTYSITEHYFGTNPRLSMSNMSFVGNPGAECQRPDVAIRVPEPSYRCAGSACRLTVEQMSRIDWSTCQPELSRPN
jgi:hypothetical protein